MSDMIVFIIGLRMLFLGCLLVLWCRRGSVSVGPDSARGPFGVSAVDDESDDESSSECSILEVFVQPCTPVGVFVTLMCDSMFVLLVRISVSILSVGVVGGGLGVFIPSGELLVMILLRSLSCEFSNLVHGVRLLLQGIGVGVGFVVKFLFGFVQNGCWIAFCRWYCGLCAFMYVG